ncbi:hypothetical protein CFOL_v3_11977 [Cephalotus follicularis]|uniref:Uncharacterized protein n=1 Tax=Cephalotus follicularis TaxID=3775 RepID=A0A1Q3BKT4_CEPFO|nr:hypothetical protein CFOL_v3_11977 [Cephalotus follicularis]
MNLLPTPPTTTRRRIEECSNCGTHNKWVIHNVRLRGIHRRLCTSCVLRLHPSSFCPSCFLFYESNPPHPSKRISCSNCSSFTHTHCASSSASPFLCPPCSDPSFTFFDVPQDNPSFDNKLALVLLCAAKIASASMGKAVIVARAEAERRVREAALARKRAREALEHVFFLDSKAREKARKNDAHHCMNNAAAAANNTNTNTDTDTNGVSEVSGLGFLGGHTDKEKDIMDGFDGFVEKRMDVERNVKQNVGLVINGSVIVKEKEKDKSGDLVNVLLNNDNTDVKLLHNSLPNQRDIGSTK